METAPTATMMEGGRYPAGVYSDPAIYDLERERLFPRTWQYLAHESEIPRPGDYVVRRIVDDSFIVVRDGDGAVRVLLNMCRHRGMQVCRSEAGHTSYFRCPYHAWTYDTAGTLVGVPFHADAYGGEAGLAKATHGLRAAPRTAVWRGMVFACLDPAGPDLERYLGDARFFLDFYMNQSEAGVEVRGPQRWRIRANWKIGAENFSGDSYHTPQTHTSVVETGLFREPKAHKRKEGANWWAGAAGGTTYKLPTTDLDANLAYLGYPGEMVAAMHDRWSAGQQALVGRAGFMVSATTIFPNLSFVHNWPQVRAGADVVPFISIRLWQPVSAWETEVCSWFAVDQSAPEWFKRDSYKAYLMCFGSSGMFEQDDVENWASITSMSRGWLASRTDIDSTMGLAVEAPPAADWPAPGRALVGYGEHNQRELLRRWAEYLF